MDKRKKTLLLTSWISVIGNAILSVSKIFVGIISGSMAVLSDGIDSASDVVTSLVMLYTSRIISRPPNLKYAYGYEKADSVATKVLSLVIFFAGIEMFFSTAKGLIFSEERELPSYMAIYVTVFSIVGKLALAAYQFRQGKKTGSSMLIANAKNMRNDIYISCSVLVGLMFTFLLDTPILDSITGLLISIYIIKVSIEIFLESNVELMDGIKDISIYSQIIDAVEQVPGASNPHRIRSRQLGNLYMISLDIEADADIKLKQAHEIAHAVEDSIRKNIENIYDIVVHIEPTGMEPHKEKYGICKTDITVTEK